MNGLIIGIAKLHGMQGTCLLGETSDYVVDAKASKSILESLLSVVEITLRKSKRYREINPNYTTASS
jgi:proteasome assembly chaperone (PAC2) family protein